MAELSTDIRETVRERYAKAAPGISRRALRSSRRLGIRGGLLRLGCVVHPRR